MLVGRLFGYFRERNQELNSAHFPGAEDDPWRPYRTLIKEFQRGASTEEATNQHFLTLLRFPAEPASRNRMMNNGCSRRRDHSTTESQARVGPRPPGSPPGPDNSLPLLQEQGSAQGAAVAKLFDVRGFWR